MEKCIIYRFYFPSESNTLRSTDDIPLRATSHLSVRLTAMRVTVNEVSSDLCEILTLIIVKIYLQTVRRRYRIARRSVVTCYNSAKPLETSKRARKRPKSIRFPLGAQVEIAFITEIMPIFQLEHLHSSPLKCLK